MYSVTLSWKTFSVYLPSFEAFLRQNCAGYVGNSASDALTLHFTEQPSEEDLTAIQDHWEALVETEETSKKEAAAKAERTVAHAKEQIPNSDLTALTPAEIKLFMSLPLTQADKEALLVKYPNQ